MPSRSPFGARMQWPEPAYTEQSQARVTACPTKGGAVRIRIALGAAVAVIAIPAIFFAFFSSTSAASARVTRHEAISQHRAPVKIDDTLMSYSQAHNVAQMVNYANAVELGQEETYLTEVAYLKAVASQQQQQAAAQAAAAKAAAAKPQRRPPRLPSTGCRRGGTGARPCRRLRRHQHEHGRLGLHPSARVRRQLRRRQRRCLPVRARHVDGTDGVALARTGLPGRGAGRGRTQALLPARLGAVDDPSRLRTVKTEPSRGPSLLGP